MKALAKDVQEEIISRIHSKSEKKTKGTLELIHSNVCGPIPSTYLSFYEYYVTFIDDYSENTWIYFLKAKDEVFGKFKEFKVLRENHSKRRRHSEQTMVENILQKILKPFVKKVESRRN